MIFVAQPYYSINERAIRSRVKMGSLYCAALLKQNIMCISSIAFGTTILNHATLPKDFSFWDQISFTLLERSSEVHVLMLQGWKESRGVAAEIQRATDHNIPVKYISLEDVWAEIYKSKIEYLDN